MPRRWAPIDTELLELTAQGLVIRAGDVFRQRIAGGGGYGDPLLRDPADVAADLRDGYITARGARDAYGVEVDADGGVDEAATRGAAAFAAGRAARPRRGRHRRSLRPRSERRRRELPGV